MAQNLKLRCSVGKQSKESRFEVVLLQEGLGNFQDAFYYSRDAIDSAVAVFEGKKGMYDHPSRFDEENQPEGSVKRIAGHYEDLKAVENSKGQYELRGTFVVPPGEQFDYARGLLQHALEYAKKYPDKDFVGFSINASGDADEMDLDAAMKKVPEACQAKLLQAKEMGITQVRWTSVISDATSCDLVTEAGAGGKVLKMLEAAKERKNMGKKVKESADKVEAKDEKDQDKEVIKGMLDKHMGEGKHDEADAAMMQKALKAAKAAGLEGDKAEEAAAHHVQLAKHMQAEEAEESEEAESESESEAESEDADGDDDGDEDDAAAKKKKPVAPPSEEAKKEKEAYENGKKESQKNIVKLQAENAALKERLGKLELTSHIEKKLEESKLPRSATKLLRETIGEVKTAKEFDSMLKIFVESRKHALGGEAGVGFQDIFENPEKETSHVDGSGSDLSFADAEDNG